MRLFARGLLLGSVASIGLLSQHAKAADAAAQNPNEIEEITVTATKRTENVKEIPQNISVLTGTALQEEHVVDYSDLSRIVPGLSFSSGGAAGLGNVEIRGVSSTAGAATVGLYLDEVSMAVRNVSGLTGAASPKLLDIDRIEVLRGPQGTLYGAGSEGGTIRFLSHQPELDTFEGSFHTEISDTARGGINYDEEGIMNAPLVAGQSAVRLAVGYSHDEGWLKRLGLDGNILNDNSNTDRVGVIRVSVKEVVNDDITILPSLFYQRTNQDDQGIYYENSSRFTSIKQLAEPDREQIFVPSIVLSDNLHFADLTSVTSYYWRKSDIMQDGTYANSSYLAYLSPDNNPLLANLVSPVQYHAHTGQITQEVRLASKSMAESGKPYTWLVGLYYSDQHLSTSDNEYVPGFSSLFQQLEGQSAVSYYQQIYSTTIPNVYVPPPPGSSSWFQNDFVYKSDRQYDERQYAAFGESSYALSPALKATIGARYLFAREALSREGGGYFDGGNPSDFNSLNRAYALTPKFALNYDVDDSDSIYANATKGFRLGGPNRPVPTTICAQDLSDLGRTSAPESYGSDNLWNYELGTKDRLLNNRLSVNAAVFFIQWNQIQQHVSLPICGFNFDTNAGSAQNYGAEFEIHAKATPEVTLGLNGGYTHARLTSVVAGIGAIVGDRVEGVPDWTLAATAEYRRSLSDSLDGYIRGDYDLVGHSSGAFSLSEGGANPDHERSAYGLLNGSFGVEAGSLQVEVFAKNLLNSARIIQQPSNSYPNEVLVPTPLTIGVALTKEF